MKRFFLSAALAASIFAGPAIAQENSSSTTDSAPAPSVNVQVDAPVAPAAPVVETSSSTVDKTTVVDHQTDGGHTDNMTLGLMAGIGVIGAAFLIGLAASNRA